MEQVLGTYSFADNYANLTGPGCSAQLAAATGAADEGVSVEFTEESNRVTTGADGAGFNTLVTISRARILARFLKTSPTNSILQQAYAYQRTSSLFWGQNIFVLTNPVLGDAVTAQGVAFTRLPRNSWGKEGPMLEWEFDAITCTMKIGSGVTVS